MIGQAWSEETVLAAMAALERDFQPISDMRASADYRLRSAKNLLRKLYLESEGPEQPLRLVGGGEGGLHAG